MATSLAGKTAIVTGGAGGLGKAYVQALVAVGVYVCFGDVNVEEGEKLAAEIKNTQFIPCDVTKWSDQTLLFRSALQFSPNGKIDYVVANAGISGKDDVFQFSPDLAEPTEPSLNIVNIDLKGVLFTTKLAMHYFIKQNGTEASPEQEDTCLILMGSGASYFDVPRAVQYSAAKYGVRGIMHGLRRMTYHYGSRVNMISPWYVATSILTPDRVEYIQSCGVEFAKIEDVSKALRHLLSNKEINGRNLWVAPRKWAPEGFLDLDFDEIPEEKVLACEAQRLQMVSAPVEKGLFLTGYGYTQK